MEGPPSVSSLHGRKMDARVIGGQPIGEVSVKTFFSLLGEALQKEKAIERVPMRPHPPQIYFEDFFAAPLVGHFTLPEQFLF